VRRVRSEIRGRDPDRGAALGVEHPHPVGGGKKKSIKSSLNLNPRARNGGVHAGARVLTTMGPCDDDGVAQVY
jgi:hypothetical protein